MNHRTRALAEKIWDYHQLKHQLEKADVILVLCSHDRKVAARGAELFLDQWAPLLIFSGGLGSITRNIWTEPEADQFARIAIELGVPKDRILVENRSTNTGENIRFTREMLQGLTIDPQSFILVQKPYMERRSFATFRKLWPEKSVRVTSPQVTFDEYLDSYAELSAKDVVGIMVGDLQRIRVYAERGFQIAQEIPGDVWCAYEELVRDGYDHYLIGE
ncbi:MAG: hypothetical protein QOE96_1839 [Blastocatellia bacterium]|jgi:uncharacterized SAM-binding protein YcdF (DUF218 family)|nr:hypothetical protein [Blastocatellia bacterium]